MTVTQTSPLIQCHDFVLVSTIRFIYFCAQNSFLYQLTKSVGQRLLEDVGETLGQRSRPSGEIPLPEYGPRSAIDTNRLETWLAPLLPQGQEL